MIPKSGVETDAIPDIGVVHARSLPPACAACGRGVDAGSFRIALNPKPIDAAYGAIGDAYMAVLQAHGAGQGDDAPRTAGDKMDVRIDGPAWICSRCAEARSHCPVCSQPEAGMRPEFRWFIDDDGLVTCNPFVPDPYGKPEGGCVNQACERYSPGADSALLDMRRHAIGVQGFPDSYIGILDDSDIVRMEPRGQP